MTRLATAFPASLSKPSSVTQRPPAAAEAARGLRVARDNAPAMIGVQAGGQYWLIDGAGSQISAVPAMASVPLTRSWFRGLVVVQGALLGVADLSAFTGGALTPVTHDSRLLHLDLTGEGPASHAAVLVGALVGERAVSELAPVPDLPDPDCTWAGAKLRDARGRLWQVLNLRALFEHPQFQDIGA